MADASALRTSIDRITDPVLLRPLGDLGMVRKVHAGLVGRTTVDLVVPVPNYPLLDQLEARVRTALAAEGVSSVEVSFSVMDDQARTAMMREVRPESAPKVGQPGSRTRVVAITSGKGGVGKSSVTTNLAVALAATGRSVGVLDADVWGFSIPRMLGITHPPVVIEESILPPAAHGVRAVSMDYFVGDDQAVIWRGPMLHKAIQQFLEDVFWDDPEFLLVDMPPGTGDVAISMSQFLPRAQVIVVTTPQPTAQRVAKRAALMAQKVNQEVIGVVENMSWFTADDGTRYQIFGEGGGTALAAELGVPLLGQIPLLPEMGRGADDGVPVELAAPGSEAARAFSDLAVAVVGRKPRVRTRPELVIR